MTLEDSLGMDQIFDDRKLHIRSRSGWELTWVHVAPFFHHRPHTHNRDETPASQMKETVREKGSAGAHAGPKGGVGKGCG